MVTCSAGAIYVEVTRVRLKKKNCVFERGNKMLALTKGQVYPEDQVWKNSFN